MKEYRTEPAITFGDDTDDRITRTQEVRKPLPVSQKSNSAAPVNVIRPISLPDNGPPISNTSAKVALQLLITTIQDTVLSHERALRLIGSRMPLFDAMDDMKGWLKTKGKHAADEDYDWCRNRLNTLLNELEQMIRRAENALKEFHDLRQLILRSITGNSGDGIARTRLRSEQEAEMRRLLENTDRWFQQFPKNLPQGKQDEVMQPPLELFIAELQLIKATHDSIVAKSGSMTPPTKNRADFQLPKEVSHPIPAGSEPQIMRTNTWRVSSQLSGNVRDTIPGSLDSKLPSTALRMDSQLSGNVRDTIPGSLDSKLPSTTLRMVSQLTKENRHPLSAGSEPQLVQTKTWRVNSQPPKTRRDSISTTAEPEVSPPTTRSSLHGSQTSVNEISTIVNAEEEHVITISSAKLTSRAPEMSLIIDSEIRSKLPPKKDLTDEAIVKDSAPKQEITESEPEILLKCTDTENKRIAIESSDSEYANPFVSSGKQEEMSAPSAKSPIVDGPKNDVDQKEYQTVEAQTRIPSHTLILDASSDHHRNTPYQMGHVSAKSPSENPVKMEPVTSSDHSSKESSNRVQLHEHTQKKEEDESNSKNPSTSVPTVTLSISSAPVEEDKKALFHISGWQWSVNDQNENTKITQPKTLVFGAGPISSLAAPISNLLELIRNHENSIWKQTKKLVLTKYVYDGPGYPSLHGVNCVLQRLWTDAEFFAFPTPPQERLKEKLEDIEELQTHLVDLYSNPKLIGELRTIIEQYKGSSRLGLDSITSRIETCSQWLRAKSKEVRKEYAEMYKLIREDANAYKRFLIERQSLVYGALDEFLGTLDEPEIFIKAIRESEAESSSADYQTLKERENWKLPRFRLRNAYSMYIDNTTRTLVRKRHAMVAWKGPRAYTN